MSEWSEIGDAMKGVAEAKRKRLEPARMDSTREALLRQGWKVEAGPDGFKSYRVTSPSGKRFVFWPYSGWWQGKTQGRGFQELLAAGK